MGFPLRTLKVRGTLHSCLEREAIIIIINRLSQSQHCPFYRDHFGNSPKLFSWECIKIVRRKLMLVTLEGLWVKLTAHI